jgi:hypothetical protein
LIILSQYAKVMLTFDTNTEKFYNFFLPLLPSLKKSKLDTLNRRFFLTLVGSSGIRSAFENDFSLCLDTLTLSCSITFTCVWMDCFEIDGNGKRTNEKRTQLIITRNTPTNCGNDGVIFHSFKKTNSRHRSPHIINSNEF